MEMLKEILNDTFMILPLLFISYLIIELIEQRNKNIDKLAYQLKKFGPLYGALMGLIPQCGFSVLAATLFIDKKITLGTLIAIFISTSDEAVPIMISDSSLHKPLLLILCGKLILAILIGYLCDALFEKKLSYRYGNSKDHEEDHHVVMNALMKTLKIYMFIFITNIVIQLFIQQIGEERLTSLLQGNHYLQMFYASLFGFIPNCVSSVVLTQLYTSHMLQFSSLFAGLTTNAGLGLLVLLKGNISFKTIVKIIIILLISAMIGGLFFSNLVI